MPTGSGRARTLAWVCSAVFAVAAAALWVATRSIPLPPLQGDRVSIDLGGARFVAELAAEPAVQHQGLSGRANVDPLGGMLFAYPSPRVLHFVMRDCLVPLDIAFLDPQGRVLAHHPMKLETPRQPWESPRQYESRLPRYTSPANTQFALEIAGGRLAELGIEVGDRARFDVGGVNDRFRRR